MKQWGKILAVAVMAALLMVVTTSCVTVNFSGGNNGKKDLVGKGETSAQSHKVDAYTSVEVDANIELIYTSGNTGKVEAEGYQNLLDTLQVEVKGDCLYIKSDRNFVVTGNNYPKITLSSDTLTHITIQGDVTLTGKDTVKADSFQLDIGGICYGKMDVDTNKFSVYTGGAADLTFTGHSENTSLVVSGTGTIDAMGLTSTDAMVSIAGTGTISLEATNTLEAIVSGSGTIQYKGNPKVTKGVSGLGSVEQVTG